MSDNAPITEELRDAMQRYDNFDGTSRVVLGESNFDRLCDAIDVTHADLERENVKLREERDHWHVEQVHAFGNWEDSYKRAVELEAENTKLRKLVGHLYYVKPRDVTSILVNGEVLDFDELMAEVGLRWEDV